MTTAEILTITIAAYAAILSTRNWLEQKKKDRPRINPVTAWSAAVVPEDYGQPGYAFDTFLSEACNDGFYPVIIAHQAFELPDGKWLIFSDAQKQLPKKLEPGEKFTLGFVAETVKRHLLYYGYEGKVQIRSVFKDQLGNIYRGKPKEFDTERRCNGEGDRNIFSWLDFINGTATLHDKGWTVKVETYLPSSNIRRRIR